MKQNQNPNYTERMKIYQKSFTQLLILKSYLLIHATANLKMQKTMGQIFKILRENNFQSKNIQAITKYLIKLKGRKQFQTCMLHHSGFSSTEEALFLSILGMKGLMIITKLTKSIESAHKKNLRLAFK